MKVLLINGSPRAKGCTYTALSEVARELAAAQIETEILHLGSQPIVSCTACGTCSKNGQGRCVFDDIVNATLDKAESCDAFVFGSPVHYAAVSGQMTSFLHRFFYAGKGFNHKPGAALVSCRRAGSTAALDQLHKFFFLADMPIVTSQYWNMVHGNTPEEVRQDLEGLQNLRGLGRNLAWQLQCIAAGRAAGITPPTKEARERTNFIR